MKSENDKKSCMQVATISKILQIDENLSHHSQDDEH